MKLINQWQTGKTGFIEGSSQWNWWPKLKTQEILQPLHSTSDLFFFFLLSIEFTFMLKFSILQVPFKKSDKFLLSPRIDRNTTINPSWFVALDIGQNRAKWLSEQQDWYQGNVENLRPPSQIKKEFLFLHSHPQTTTSPSHKSLTDFCPFLLFSANTAKED